MKNKKKCAVCAKRFEPIRSDKKYCSNACKQKAHVLRQTSERRPEKAEMVFYFDEYQYTCKQFSYDSESLPFILFCFFRKELSINASLESVAEYINSFWTSEGNQEFTRTKAYRNFMELFLCGEYRVLPNK